METLTEIWAQYQPIIMTILMGLWTVVLIPLIRWIVTKTLNKFDSKKEANQTAEKVIEKINGAVFSHDIQPLVESEMVKVKEAATQMLQAEITEIKKGYSNLIEILKSLSAYFDNSIGVSEETKAKLKSAIDAAEESKTNVATGSSQIVIATNVKKKKKNDDIER